MYESPLEKIYGEIHEQIVKQDEENMMYAINQAVGYKVDKEELIKALQYDRNQYEKGKKEMQEKIYEAIEEIKQLDSVNIEYCPSGYEEYISKDDVLEILKKHIGEVKHEQ